MRYIQLFIMSFVFILSTQCVRVNANCSSITSTTYENAYRDYVDMYESDISELNEQVESQEEVLSLTTFVLIALIVVVITVILSYIWQIRKKQR